MIIGQLVGQKHDARPKGAHPNEVRVRNLTDTLTASVNFARLFTQSIEEQMPTERRITKLEMEQKAKEAASAIRMGWLKQLLDWPLEDGPLASRFTEAEIVALKDAVKQNRLFFGL